MGNFDQRRAQEFEEELARYQGTPPPAELPAPAERAPSVVEEPAPAYDPIEAVEGSVGEAPEEQPIDVKDYLAKKFGFDDELKAAKERQQNKRTLAAMGEGADQIGASIAGVKSDPSYYRTMATQADTDYKAAADDKKLVNEYMKTKLSDERALRKEDRDERRLDQGDKRLGVMEKALTSRVGIQDHKAVERAQKTMLGRIASIDAAGRAAANIEGLADLARTNPTAAAAIPVQMARASGEKGVLSDYDIKTWGGSQAIFDRLMRASQRAADGTLPAPELQWMKEVAQRMQANAEAAKTFIEEDTVAKHTSNYKGDADENFHAITGRQRGERAPQHKGAVGYSEAQESGISRVMKDNGLSREEAIKALQDAKKL